MDYLLETACISLQSSLHFCLHSCLLTDPFPSASSIACELNTDILVLRVKSYSTFPWNLQSPAFKAFMSRLLNQIVTS